MHYDINDDPVVLGGWKGFLRFPFALIFASALTIASVLLVAKFNPLIIYSSGYVVWTMTLSIFYISFWLIVRGASFVRPSALHRGFVMVWLYVLGWAVQVLAAVAEDRLHLGALYSAAFLQTAVFLALLISLLEQFALLGKHDFAMQLHDAHQARDVSRHPVDQAPPGRAPEQAAGGDDEEDDEDTPTSPTERTPLRAGEPGYGSSTSFANTYRRSVAENSPTPPSMRTYKPYDHEQSWSGRLPSWTWIIQFLLLAPVPVIMLGNLGLIAMSALQMTQTDGGSLMLPLLALGAISIILLIPITPFMHRITHHIPMFLVCVFAGSLIYNLVAFPFSDSHRFKFYFKQTVNLDKGENKVVLSGLESYVRQVTNSLPHASGQEIECKPSERGGLKACSYDASMHPPIPVDGVKLEDLISFTKLAKLGSQSDATVKFQLHALDTRVCYLKTSRPVFGFSVQGGASRDPRFGSPPSDGFQLMELMRRDRERPWIITLQLTESAVAGTTVTVDENASDSAIGDGELKVRSSAESEELAARQEPLDIEVICGWSDANKPNAIPAFHELVKYMPTWAAVTKAGVALVEISKTFSV